MSKKSRIYILPAGDSLNAVHFLFATWQAPPGVSDR